MYENRKNFLSLLALLVLTIAVLISTTPSTTAVVQDPAARY